MRNEYRIYESIEEWRERARTLFGDNPRKWRHCCPVCGNVASVQDFLDAGVSVENVSCYAFCCCIGRLVKTEGTGEVTAREADIKAGRMTLNEYAIFPTACDVRSNGTFGRRQTSFKVLMELLLLICLRRPTQGRWIPIGSHSLRSVRRQIENLLNWEPNGTQ
ncbi:MAG: hypothetical protein LBQ54_16030 [Planctomycetaceae bacterium]|jgi:hypothetical protein|nr:hypothetical protein [Planctomycetaceae bacterium]